MSKTLTVHHTHRVAVNQRDTLRNRLGMALRNAATRIDGRVSLAVEIATAPRLTASQKTQCIRRSLDDLTRYVKQETEIEAGEQLLRFASPELFEEAP